MKNGFTRVNVPGYHYVTCRGCKFLKSTACMRGRFVHTDTYTCTHEDAPKALFLLTGNIATNISDAPVPPDWCPFRKSEKQS
jgi:hypothetical protein